MNYSIDDYFNEQYMENRYFIFRDQDFFIWK